MRLGRDFDYLNAAVLEVQRMDDLRAGSALALPLQDLSLMLLVDELVVVRCEQLKGAVAPLAPRAVRSAVAVGQLRLALEQVFQ